MPKAALLILSILVILVFLVLTVSFIANTLFNQKVRKEVKELFNNNVQNKKDIISKADLEGLPICVQKWLENSQVIGKERIRTVRLKQKGLMRMKEGQPWMPAEAEQYFTIDEPGFIWKAKIKVAPLLYFVGRDKYYNGKGNMLIKILSLVTVADARGKELDQGTLLRYLAEIVWFPTAALSSYIKWEGIDSNSARATMSYKGVTASGVFIFNEMGEVINFVAKRYMESSGQYVMETWSTPMKDYKDLNGIRIPTKGEVIWNLKTGDFSWYQVEITEIEYNKPIVY
ncbi:MAG: hypothetical protein H0Z35_03240 [Thermoanaerobacteraceae bacterium]|nr:hypothetical protein [Thermoanaerobacteraceae bacterium]